MELDTKMKIRKPYTRHQSQSVNTMPSRTKQSDADRSNINVIMDKYLRTGAITHFNKHHPQYGDATGTDYHTAMTIVTEASQMFDELPSNIRNRFQNNPAAFLDFVQDEGNTAEMAQMGLTNSPVQERNLNSETAPEPTLETEGREEPS